MLRELRLNNLAIIKNLDLEFNEGLISLTGETGAGKSIILDGISLLIGERSNLEMIRTGEESLFAEGVFDLSEVQKEKLNKLGFEIEDDELIISRYFYRNSKSKITVNGMRMTVSKLKELMRNVLDLVGQHEHQYLLNKNYHLGLLDRFLDKNGQELAKEIRNNVSSLKMINKKIEEIETEKFRIMEKKDILKVECDIDSLNLDVLAYIDHNITVNVIRDGEIVEKRALTLPKEIRNVMRCHNPRCITSIEQGLPHIFYLADEENETYRCKYCDEQYTESDSDFV